MDFEVAIVKDIVLNDTIFTISLISLPEEPINNLQTPKTP